MGLPWYFEYEWSMVALLVFGVSILYVIFSVSVLSVDFIGFYTLLVI